MDKQRRTPDRVFVDAGGIVVADFVILKEESDGLFGFKARLGPGFVSGTDSACGRTSYFEFKSEFDTVSGYWIRLIPSSFKFNTEVGRKV